MIEARYVRWMRIDFKGQTKLCLFIRIEYTLSAQSFKALIDVVLACYGYSDGVGNDLYRDFIDADFIDKFPLIKREVPIAFIEHNLTSPHMRVYYTGL